MPTEDLTPKIAGNPDVLTAFLSHHYLKKDEREKATKTCRSLLKPGGLYVTFENIRPSTKKGLEAGMNSWRRFQLSQGRDEKSVEKHLKRYDTKYFPITVEEHIALLKRCGFKVCELLWYSCLQGGFYGIK